MIKRVFLIFFIIFHSFAIQTTTLAYADNQSVNNNYLRVVTTDTPIFSDVNQNDFLFFLPYSYYVKVLEDLNNVVRVECFGFENTPCIDGYVPKDKLEKVQSQVITPYVQLNIITKQATVLYSDIDCQTPLRSIFSQRELGYYGQAQINNGEYVYFVYYLGFSGYVKESGIVPFTMPLHPDPIITQTPNSEPEHISQEKTTKDYSTLKLVIILCLLVAGVIAFFMVVTKSSKRNTTPYYEEEIE